MFESRGETDSKEGWYMRKRERKGNNTLSQQSRKASSKIKLLSARRSISRLKRDLSRRAGGILKHL